MKNGEEPNRRSSILHSRLFLFFRGGVPLLLVALALLAGPALLAWRLRGGRFGFDDALIGGAISATLLIVLGLAFGWAIGRIGRGRRR
jgi:uncharacterized BrkB/YihY/UPF0761 family membrane protein